MKQKKYQKSDPNIKIKKTLQLWVMIARWTRTGRLGHDFLDVTCNRTTEHTLMHVQACMYACTRACTHTHTHTTHTHRVKNNVHILSSAKPVCWFGGKGQGWWVEGGGHRKTNSIPSSTFTDKYHNSNDTVWTTLQQCWLNSCETYHKSGLISTTKLHRVRVAHLMIPLLPAYPLTSEPGRIVLKCTTCCGAK